MACDLNMQGCEQTVEEVRKLGGTAIAQQVDVGSADSIRAAVAEAEKQFGGLHVVFNNAGVMLSGDDDAETTTEDIWDKTFDMLLKF